MAVLSGNRSIEGWGPCSIRSAGFSIRSAGPFAALWLASCGGFANEPLRTGAIRGSLVEADPAVAVVTILGTDRRATLDQTGFFEFTGVAAGTVELHLVASARRASRATVDVGPGRLADLGAVPPAPAAYLNVEVRTRNHQLPRGTAWVALAPWSPVALSDSGRARLGPLGAGCWTVEVDVPGLGRASASACPQEGEEEDVRLLLEGTGGCAITGCERGTRCAPDGRCVFCLQTWDCPAGFSCAVDGRCVGLQPPCRHCWGEWECGGSRCEPLPGEEDPVCVKACSPAEPCDPGFSCDPTAGVCVPSAPIGSCEGYLGSPCQGDSDCDALSEGACVDNRCTVDCTGPADCPLGFHCADLAGRRVCSPR
jgi:hypothetical protein